MSLLDIWSRGLRLDDAWWEHADEHDKEYRRNIKTRVNLHFNAEMLQLQLIDAIFDNELIAIGVQELPTAGTGPEIIPKFLFGDRPEIDWQKSSLRAFGYVYGGIRVVTPDKLKEARGPVAVRPGPRGRPSVENQLDEVIQDLVQAGRLEGISQKERENRTRVRAQELYSRLFPPPRPSRMAILKALKRAGF